MNIEREKPVCLPNLYALGLQRLAEDQGVTEDTLLEKALDLLFQKEMGAERLSEWEYLKELEAELGPMPPRRSMPAFDPKDIVSVVSAPMDPAKIRRRGQAC